LWGKQGNPIENEANYEIEVSVKKVNLLAAKAKPDDGYRSSGAHD